MDFRFTPEQEAFRDSVRRFAERHLAAGALERAHAAEYPWDVSRLMAKQGLLGITVAEADGGQGGALMDAVIAIETVASVCPRSADVMQAGNFGPIRVLAEYGTPQQKNRYLTRLLAGEGVICVGMTEPEAGSAVTDLTTTATRRRRRLPDQRLEGLHHARAVRRRDPRLRALRSGRGRHRLGARRHEIAQASAAGSRSTFMSGEEWAQI